MTRKRLDSIGVLVLLAIAVGAALRFVRLGDVPPSLNVDEAVNGYDAYSLALTGRDHHGHPWPVLGLESYGDWVSPLLTFLTAPVVGLFGLNAASVRAATAILGTLAIPAMYLLGVEMFRRRGVGLAAAWYMAVSPWAVHRGRFAIPPSLVPTMVTLTMLAVAWAARRRSGRAAVAAGLSAGLTMATYPTMKLYVPLLLLAALLVFRHELLQVDRRALVIAVVVFLALAAPIYYLSLAVPDGQMRWQQVTVLGKGHATGFFVRQYAVYFSPRVFLLQGNGHPAQTPTPPGHGVELRSMIPFLVAGGAWIAIAALGRRWPSDRPFAQFLLLALLLYPVPGAMTIRAPHLNRGVHLIPLLALLAGVGVVVLADLLARLLRPAAPVWRRRALVVAACVAIAVVGAGLAARYRDYFVDYPRRASVLGYFQYGLEQEVAYALAHQAEYDTVWLAGGNETYMYLLFYGRWPPREVQRELRLRRSPGRFTEADAFRKYRFGPVSRAPVTGLPLLGTLRDPNGLTTSEIRGGASATGERVLVIAHLSR